MAKKTPAETVSRPSKENQVETIVYEINMLEYCFERLREKRWADEQEANLCIEGFLLHYRNLIEFFGNHGRGLRVGAPHDWSPKLLSEDEIESLLDMSLLDDCGEVLSRYLTHCNEIRARKDINWKHVEMYKRIEPRLKNFRKLFPSSPRQAEPVSAMMHAEAASTASVSELLPPFPEPLPTTPAPRKDEK